MTDHKKPFLLGAILCLATVGVPAWADPAGPSESEITFGGRAVHVDADGDRDARFDLNRDTPDGLFLEHLLVVQASADARNTFLLLARDAMQRDEELRLVANFGNRFRLRGAWWRSPHRYGDGARYLPGRLSDDEYRFPDLLQQSFQDPDGDATPYYSADKTDNALVQEGMNQLLADADPFSLATRRRTGEVGFDFHASQDLSFSLDLSREWRDGLHPVGSGTYDRATDVNGDGKADYDSVYGLRGNELPEAIDYRTTRVRLSGSLNRGPWFAEVGAQVADFSNEIASLTYDNPFWYTDTAGSSGTRRGLWEQGRIAGLPDSGAWDFDLSGGLRFAGNSQLQVTAGFGGQSQDEDFLPITTNTALIGSQDINGDGKKDAADNPTITATLPAPNLGAEVSTKLLSATLSSRPWSALKLKGQVRYYEYDSDHDRLGLWRAEYVESLLTRTFQGANVDHLPLDYDKLRISGEGILRLHQNARLAIYGDHTDFNRDRYVDEDGGSFDRDLGTRSVQDTTEGRFGLKLTAKAHQLLEARLAWTRSRRDYGGTYQPFTSADKPDLRQFDLANRDRDQFDIGVDFYPVERVTAALTWWHGLDEYPDTAFGLTEGRDRGVAVNLTYAEKNGFSLFGYGQYGVLDRDTHLQAKCSNCTPPAGATWKTPWAVPGFDWYSTYADTTTSLGFGASYKPTKRDLMLALNASYSRGNVEQSSENSSAPLDLARGGALALSPLAHDYPDIENELVTLEARAQKNIFRNLSLGASYLYEDFRLDDFRWDDLAPYGPNAIDPTTETTRYLYLDSRYSDYTAHVVQGFLNLRF